MRALLALAVLLVAEAALGQVPAAPACDSGDGTPGGLPRLEEPTIPTVTPETQLLGCAVKWPGGGEWLRPTSPEGGGVVPLTMPGLSLSQLPVVLEAGCVNVKGWSDTTRCAFGTRLAPAP